MSSVFIRLGPGGAINWRESVESSTQLPTTGNTIGDVRTTKDTGDLYIWKGAVWDLIAGGGGSSPGGNPGAIQFNNTGSFGGADELKWNNTDKFIDLNGLALKALSSSLSLVDNQPVPVTAFSYSATTYNFTIVEYSVTRNTAKQVGRFYIVNDSSSVTITNDFGNLDDIGVIFSAIVESGLVKIQYVTTSTGFNAFFKYALRQWI